MIAAWLTSWFSFPGVKVTNHRQLGGLADGEYGLYLLRPGQSVETVLNFYSERTKRQSAVWSWDGEALRLSKQGAAEPQVVWLAPRRSVSHD